jgi:LDH2 family malate/lactate/ureidoglycolate dehydrogenase
VQGGAEVLGFATKKGAASSDALEILSGIISSGPFIRSAQRINPIQIKLGTLAANIGLGNFLITNPLDVKVRLLPVIQLP